MKHFRDKWSSKIGFILAASGSAIGIGNIVFFSSNAYKFGGGAFYLPYLVALFVLGLPIMMLELGIGSMTSKSFPMAMRELSGKKGEFVGWWAMAGTLFILMYYITILAWALGMLLGSFGSLFDTPTYSVFDNLALTANNKSRIFFFNQLTTWKPAVFVLVIWLLNWMMLKKGTASIEKAVQLLVPIIWIFMLLLVIRGVSLDGGIDGVMYLFTPNWQEIFNPSVWSAAFSQMFFSLSLGFGILTSYASYLPKNANHVNNAFLISFLNCSFEFIAGIAIFSLLFVFAIHPIGATISLSFFVVPQGIDNISDIGWLVQVGGVFFFLLLVIAGLSSSISMIEAIVSALRDKLQIQRKKALLMVTIPGIFGSLLFTLPYIIDPEITGNGTLGLTMLDLLDHWVFKYGLLLIGLSEVVLLGWVLGADMVRKFLNKHSKINLGHWFNYLLKYVIPILLVVVLVFSFLQDFPLYGSRYDMPSFDWLPLFIPFFWLLSSYLFAYLLTFKVSSP